jgi:large subunit ribosomal protein L24
MAKQHVKKGDEVVVISGTERGKRGKVIEVLPGSERVIVEGIKMIKRHTKRSQQHPEGAIVEREGTLHWSNVMRAESFDARAGKRGAAQPAPANA